MIKRRIENPSCLESKNLLETQKSVVGLIWELTIRLESSHSLWYLNEKNKKVRLELWTGLSLVCMADRIYG